jgi:hypothetical protein
LLRFLLCGQQRRIIRDGDWLRFTREPRTEPAKDIVHDRFCVRDLLIVREPTRLESNVTEFVDVDTSSLRAALTVADILVVPVLPATFDVWSLDPPQELIHEAREINRPLRAIVILNAADAQGRDNEEPAAIIRDKEGFDTSLIRLCGAKRFEMPRPPVFRCLRIDLQTKSHE